MARTQHVLVTGGNGRLGEYVVRSLKDEFHVTIFDRVGPGVDCNFIAGNILNRDSLTQAMTSIDTVVHLAALDADVAATESEFMRVNVEGTWNVFDCASAAGVKKVVHCSSVAAVNISPENPPQYLPVDVDHPAEPEIAYGLSKLLGEKIAQRFATLGQMDVLCLRPAFVLQPNIIYDVARTTAEVDGTTPPSSASHPSWIPIGEVVPGSRSFVDPRDAATAFKAAVQAEGISWGIFNVASTDSYSELDTMTVVEREFGVRPECRNTELYSQGSRASIYDISSTTRTLGWKPVHNWASILDEVLSLSHHDENVEDA